MEGNEEATVRLETSGASKKKKKRGLIFVSKLVYACMHICSWVYAHTHTIPGVFTNLYM